MLIQPAIAQNGRNDHSNTHPALPNEFVGIRQRASTADELHQRTAGLHLIQGTRVLGLFDAENQYYSASNRGVKLNLGALVSAIHCFAHALEAHGFVSTDRNNAQSLGEDLADAGTVPHVRDVRGWGSHCRELNSDAQLLIHAGQLMNSARHDAVIIGSGDGELALAIAEYAATLGIRNYVARFPWSTAQRLRADKNPLVAGNIWYGLDVCVSQTGSAAVFRFAKDADHVSH
jgi:uncharacterized LabA/DUF88 family protein